MSLNEMESETGETMTLKLEIDAEQGQELEKRAEEHGFESIEEYSEIILQTVIDELESDDRETDEEVTERLEDLGYLS